MLILGSRKTPGVEAVWFGYRSVKLDFQVRVVHFQGRLCRIFGKFSLKVDPAGFTLGFRVKFGVGPVSWYQSIRLSDFYHYLFYLVILSVFRVMVRPRWIH